jgi:opacity protein-like surface antigen
VKQTRQLLSPVFLIFALNCTTNAAETETDKWQFKISPYLWVASIQGSTGAEGIDSGIDTDYNFLSLDNLEGAFFIAASASKGRWTIQTDVVFLKFADEGDFDPFTANIDLDGHILELSGAYRPGGFEYTEVIFGLREVALNLDVGLTPGPQGVESKSWLDPLVGIRHVRPLGERWQARIRADVGGFGVSSDLTFNVLVGADFNMTKHSSLFMGYRYLTLDFSDGGFLVDLTADGLVLGVEFGF